MKLTTGTTDAPSLLNRSGFTLTTVDTDEITINFPSMWELMADLRDMGESNAILGRRAQISRDVLMSAEAIYKGAWGMGGARCKARDREQLEPRVQPRKGYDSAQRLRT